MSIKKLIILTVHSSKLECSIVKVNIILNTAQNNLNAY